MSYEAFVSLTLNMARAKARHAERIREGILLARGDNPNIAKSRYHHLTDDPQEAMEWYVQDKQAAMLAQVNRGG